MKKLVYTLLVLTCWLLAFQAIGQVSIVSVNGETEDRSVVPSPIYANMSTVVSRDSGSGTIDLLDANDNKIGIVSYGLLSGYSTGSNVQFFPIIE
ncbi:MAG: hypothetical protein AAFO69_08115, partial [Bacteroidota bacterium]